MVCNKNITNTLENPVSHLLLLLICMLYMSIMICNAVLANRYIGADKLFVLGGTITSPFVFVLDDIVAEIYGYKVARFMIISGFVSQTVFAIICQFVVSAPYPSFFSQQDAYRHILGFSLLRINFAGCLAYIVANLVNSFILTRWKALLKGRFFWLRSIGSSVFSGAIYYFIAILLMELYIMQLRDVFKVILLSYLVKTLCCIIFSVPAQMLINAIRKVTGIDVYDFPVTLIPYASIKYPNEKRP